MQNKIVWTEGLLLTQQHLQHLQIEFQSSFLEPCDEVGVIDLDFDHEQIKQGIFNVIQLRAILPGKRYVSFDASMDPVLAYDFRGATKNAIEIGVYQSENNLVSGIPGYPVAPAEAAWRAVWLTKSDSYDPQRETEILVARAQLKLTEISETAPGLALVRLIKKTNSIYEVDEHAGTKYLWMTVRHPCYELVGNIMEHLKQISCLENWQNFLLKGYVDQLEEIYTQKIKCRTVLNIFKKIGRLLMIKDHFSVSNDYNLANYGEAILERCISLKKSVVNEIVFEPYLENFYWAEIKEISSYKKVFLTIQSTQHYPKDWFLKIKIAPLIQIQNYVISALPGMEGILDPKNNRRFMINLDGSLWKACCEEGALGLYVPVALKEFQYKLELE